jgi:hypothetical protein
MSVIFSVESFLKINNSLVFYTKLLMNLGGVMRSFVPASDRHQCNICLKYTGSLSRYLISATIFFLNNAGLKRKTQVHGLQFLFISIAI